ncbi:MAG: tetratricopeptide repeat protein [Bryobacteraceae bacterium]
MADANNKMTAGLSDHWLWIVDDQYIHAPLGSDTLEPDDKKRKVELPALAKAINLNAEGKTVKALREVESAVQAGDNTPELHWARGQLDFELKRFEDAKKAYERVLALRPKNKGATFNIALCLEKLGRFEEAAERFRQVARLDPDLPAARVGLGGCLLHLDKPEDGLKEFSTCLEKDPEYDRALAGKAVALHMLRKYDDAFEMYTKALQLHPNDEDLYANLVAVSAARRDEPRLRDYAETLLKMV